MGRSIVPDRSRVRQATGPRDSLPRTGSVAKDRPSAGKANDGADDKQHDHRGGHREPRRRTASEAIAMPVECALMGR